MGRASKGAGNIEGKAQEVDYEVNQILGSSLPIDCKKNVESLGPYLNLRLCTAWLVVHSVSLPAFDVAIACNIAVAKILQKMWEGPCWEGVWLWLDPWDVVRLRTSSS